MTAHWKEQLQAIIDLSRERIRRLKTEASADAPSLCVEATGQIEAEEKNIAKLQRIMDALD